MRALVINGLPGTASAVHAALDDGGWEVAEAADRVAAMVAMEDEHVDLVVVNLCAPSTAELGLVTEMRERHANLSILVLVTGPGTHRGVAGLLAGADDFLTCPFSQQEILARLGAAARRRIRSSRTRSRLQQVITGVTSEVSDAVIITTADGRIKSFNRGAEDLYGFREVDVIGRPASDVLRWVGEEAAFEQERMKLAEAGSWHGVAEQYRSDGSTVRVRSSTRVLRDDDGTEMGFISVNRTYEHLIDAERRLFELGQEELAEALAADEFFVHYQPIFLVEDRTVVGVEALARWQHGVDLRFPCDFIAAAEQSDLIIDIGTLVLRKACRQLHSWRETGRDLHLTVNLSARQLLDPGLVDILADVLTATSVPAKRLTLEVTETSLIHDVEHASKTLLRIANLGVGVSIDDFGTGWASLTYLQRLPVSCLKIDRTFIAHLGLDRRDTAIVRSIIALGRELDLTVIAEGVENEVQLEHLRLLGCRVAQGYLVARPAPAEELDLPVRRS